jgi:hypothetical protein
MPGFTKEGRNSKKSWSTTKIRTPLILPRTAFRVLRDSTPSHLRRVLILFGAAGIRLVSPLESQTPAVAAIGELTVRSEFESCLDLLWSLSAPTLGFARSQIDVLLRFHSTCSRLIQSWGRNLHLRDSFMCSRSLSSGAFNSPSFCKSRAHFTLPCGKTRHMRSYLLRHLAHIAAAAQSPDLL